MDGRGLHTRAHLLAQCSHLQQQNQTRLSLQPLFFFPNVWERNLEVSEAIAWTITQQLLAQEASTEPSEPWLEAEDAPLSTASLTPRLKPLPNLLVEARDQLGACLRSTQR